MSIVGPEAAEDIAQDALLLAFNALPDLDEPDRFAAWLGAITRNRALRWLRNENRVRRVEFDEGLIGYLEGVATGDQRGKQAAAELVEGLDQLPEEYRLIMRLKWLDEMSMEQIAAYTGLTVSTVKWRLHEGKKKLRAWRFSDSRNKGELRDKRRSKHGARQRNPKATQRTQADGAYGADEPVDGYA